MKRNQFLIVLAMIFLVLYPDSIDAEDAEIPDDCDFPLYIEGGLRMELQEGRAGYECFDGYKLPETIENSGGWVECNDGGYSPEYPRCESSHGGNQTESGHHEGDCRLPEYIEGGQRMEFQNDKARYECSDGSKFPESIENSGGWVECNDGGYSPEYPRCESSHGGNQTESGHQYEPIGEMPRAVIEMKQFFAHGPMETTSINKGEPKSRIMKVIV